MFDIIIKKEGDTMKLVVFSDAHGRQMVVDRILDFNPDADYFISLGDSELPQEYFMDHDIVYVKGNYPRDPGFVYETELEVAGKRIYITHGHKFKVHRTLDKLIKFGISNNYDIVLFGHSHILHLQKLVTTWFINPGSCSSSRNQFPPSYCIIEIDANGVVTTFKEAMTNSTIEVLL